MVQPNRDVENALDPAALRDLFEYDPRTGVLVWRRTGKVAGVVEASGYMRVKIGGRKGRRFMVHRVIWALVTGEWPTELVDHRNKNRTDNRWQNLREATYGQNAQNQSPKGVYWRENLGKYVVTVWLNGRHHYAGLFTNFDEARAAHAKLKAELHPFTA